MAGAEEDSVEAAAVARRERLRALKAAQQLLSTPDNDDDQHSDAKPQNANNKSPPQLNREQEEDDDDEEEDNQQQQQQEDEDNVSVKFRNYLPHDKQLQDGKFSPPVLPKFEDPVLAAPPVEEKKEDPFLNIAPKKPNWDLRRDVQKKLDKLEKRTQKAMLKLMEQEEAKRAAEDGVSDEERTENGAED